MGEVLTAESGPVPIIEQVNPAMHTGFERAPELAAASSQEDSWRQKLTGFSQEAFDFFKNKRSVATVMMVGAAALGGVSTASAATMTPEVKRDEARGVTYVKTAETTLLVGSHKQTAESFTRLRVIGNHRTVSRARVKKAIREDMCETFSAKEVVEMGVKTQGRNGSGISYGQENRKSRLCDLNGDGIWDVRGECGNRVIVRKPRPDIAKQTLWVGNFNKAKVRVVSKLAVKATSDCRLTVPGGSVSTGGYGYAETSSTINISMRSAVKNRNKGVEKAISQTTKSNNDIHLTLENNASADATSTCNSDVGGGGGTTEVCPPGAPGFPPNCYPSKPANRPPSGRMNPPDHLYTNAGTRNICISDISDPDGDRVNAHGFDFRTTTNAPVGTWNPNEVFTIANGDQCTRYTVNPNYIGYITVSAILSDGKGGNTTVADGFPVLDGVDMGGN